MEMGVEGACGERNLSFPKNRGGEVYALIGIEVVNTVIAEENGVLEKCSIDLEEQISKVGMALDSEEELHTFDKKYACGVGFGVQKISTKTKGEVKYYSLACFKEVNHHGQSILFGCGILSREDIETYVWLFKSWLECMPRRAPKAIITYQCQSIQAAVAQYLKMMTFLILLNMAINYANMEVWYYDKVTDYLTFRCLVTIAFLFLHPESSPTSNVIDFPYFYLFFTTTAF